MKTTMIALSSLFAFQCSAELVTFETIKEAWIKDIKESAKELGSDDGKPVTNGFLFLDGRYIPPPYRVTRMGHAILINDIFIDADRSWTSSQKIKKTSLIDKPEIPKTITENSSKYDKDVIGYTGDMAAYLESKYGKDEMVKRMVDVFKSLPCVHDASPCDPFSIYVIWKNKGSTEKAIRTQLVLPERGTTENTQENIIKEIQTSRNIYETRLKLNDYYFLSPKGYYSRMTGTQEGALRMLIHLIPILETSKSDEEVFDRMQALKIIIFDRRMSKSFFENKDSITPELKQRLESLRFQEEERTTRHRKDREKFQDVK